MNHPTYIPKSYPENQPSEYGQYIVVVRVDKINVPYIRTWGTNGWNFDNNNIVAFYLPKLK